MKSKLLLLLPLLLFALGCSKSDDPASTASCLISKIEYKTYLSPGVLYTNSMQTFEYNNSNKLVKHIRGGVEFEYVWESGLVKSVKRNGQKVQDWIYTNGKLSKIVDSADGPSANDDVVLNAEGQPTKLQKISVYTYNSSGNLVTENGNNYKYSNHDTNPNPGQLLAASVNLSFFPQVGPDSGVLGARGTIYGKNNAREFDGTGGAAGQFSIVYTYNARGQVATITRSRSNGYSEAITISYSNCN